VNTLSLVIHVTAAVLLVGPQVLLWFAVIPSTWLIDDERLRRNVTRVVTARFGMMSGLALIALLVTGIYQYTQVPADVRTHMNNFWWGPLFQLKIGLLVLFLGLLAFHVFFVAPVIARLSDKVIADGGTEDDVYQLDSQRRLSFLVSLGTMLVSLALVVAGVMLGDHGFSYVRR
jgi:uncharacterized membrane protein